ncbi:MAG: ribosome maturation factor RimM [Gemmatimonadota bacterium]
MRDIVVGFVRRPHGLDGELLVHPETDDPAETFRPGRMFRVGDPPEGMPAVLTLESAGPQSRGWRLKFREIGDVEGAESYAGCSLELSEEELVKLSQNEFFLHDLIGLEVRQTGGASIGHVEWVIDRPGQPVLVVAKDDNKGVGSERMIPFSPAIVSEVDLEARVIRIDPPPGLLDV